LSQAKKLLRAKCDRIAFPISVSPLLEAELRTKFLLRETGLLAEGVQPFTGDLFSAEVNRAFVLTEFFGYLRRNPNDLPDLDYTGYEFWLNKLNQFNGDTSALRW